MRRFSKTTQNSLIHSFTCYYLFELFINLTKNEKMKNELLPKRFPGLNGEVYAGFWIRVAAKLVDVIIMLPVIVLLMYVNSLSKSAYFYAIIPSLLVNIIYEVVLVKIYGGTPGKLIMGIKIIQKNGDDIDWRAACYRYSVEFFLAILGVYVMILTLNMIDDATYTSLGFLKRSQLLADINPIPNKVQSWLNGAWIIIGLIVLVFNARKRSTHDFIAGTVVIKAVMLDKVRQIISQTDTE